MTERLDAALAARGLARSRTHAAKLIAAGVVSVDGVAIAKASSRVSDSQEISVEVADHYVSRGARKLIAALDAFPVAVDGRLALDVGASTGGFTQVLLERGARAVVALDVGHGQLAEPVASDPRVVAVEGCNVRYLTPETLASISGRAERPGLIVADLSFISLPTVLPAISSIAAPRADVIVLIKPQFEVGRSGIHEGVVRNTALRQRAVENVLWAAWDQGLGTAGIIASPLLGGHGNHEYLAYLSASAGAHPTEWVREIPSMDGA